MRQRRLPRSRFDMASVSRFTTSFGRTLEVRPRSSRWSSPWPSWRRFRSCSARYVDGIPEAWPRHTLTSYGSVDPAGCQLGPPPAGLGRRSDWSCALLWFDCCAGGHLLPLLHPLESIPDVACCRHCRCRRVPEWQPGIDGGARKTLGGEAMKHQDLTHIVDHIMHIVVVGAVRFVIGKFIVEAGTQRVSELTASLRLATLPTSSRHFACISVYD